MRPEIEDALKKIPFMTLDYNFNFEKLKEEVLSYQEYYSGWWPPFWPKIDEFEYSKTDLRAFEESGYHKEYKQISLINVDPKRRSSFIQEYFQWENNDGTIQRYYDLDAASRKLAAGTTEAAIKYPYLMELVKKLTDNPILVKIITGPPGHSFAWHSHHNPIPEIGKPAWEEQCLLHIPIDQHPDVAFMVHRTKPLVINRLRSLEYNRNSDQVHVGSFVPGKIYFFNSYKFHAMKNYSNRPRINVLIYSDINNNPALEKVMETAVSNYKGPLMEL